MSSLFLKAQMKQLLCVWLVLALLSPIIGLAGTSSTVYAEESYTTKPTLIKSITLERSVTDWVYNENAGQIYTISRENNKLTFLNAQELTIDKELLVGSYPSDIEQYGDELFIALSGASIIQTVDVSSKSLSRSFTTIGQPKNLAVTSDYLFYTNAPTGWNNIYQLDLATGSSTLLNVSYVSDPVLQADEQNSILYIGETGSSGSDLHAFNYQTKQLVSSATYDGGYGFGFPYPDILFDGTDVFFGGSRMNGANLAEIHGQYSRWGDYYHLNSSLLDLKGAYLATNQGIFDKDHYVRLAEFPYEASKALIASEEGLVFLQNRDDTRTIHAYQVNVNVPRPTLSFTEGIGGAIVSNYKIDSWTTEESSPYFYGVSTETNELAVISKSDLSLVDKRYVGSMPIHAALKGDKLYIALRGETYIGVIDADNIQSPIQRILIPSNPDQVLPTKSNIFYWGQDTFHNFHVTDGITDKRVSTDNGDNAGLGSADYDASTNMLYAADYDQIYRINPDTLVISEQKSLPNTYSCSGILEVSGDSLFYCGKRIAKNEPNTVLGTYPERVLHASDPFVFSTKAIYNRDTYVKILDLPFEWKAAYHSENGAIYAATENRLYKFAGIEGIQGYKNTMMVPSDVSIVDYDSRVGSIRGELIFRAAEDAAQINGYSFYFLDAAGNKLTYFYGFRNSQDTEDGRIVYDIDTSIPNNAVYVGVYAMPNGDTPKDLAPATALLWDVPTYLAESFIFEEGATTDEQVIQGKVSWLPGKEQINVMYGLYFFGESGIIGDQLAQIAGGLSSYSYDLPPTKLPEDARGLALTQTSGDSEAPVYQYLVFDRYLSPAPNANDIVLVKNQSTQDTVTVKNVKAGDRIKIYDYYGDLLGGALVGSGLTSATIYIHNFGNPGDLIYVTITNPGGFESNATEVTIPAINSGGGTTNPNPGTPGPVGPGPGGDLGGGGVESTEGLKAIVEKDSSGKTVGKVTVPAKYVDTELTGDAFKKDKTIKLVVDSKEPSVIFNIPTESLKKIVNQAVDGKLEVSTPAGSWSINVQSLLAAIGESSSIQAVEVRIEQVDDSLTSELKKHLNAGAQVLGKPMNFEVTVTEGGTTRKLDSFTQYANHIITIPMASVKMNELAGLMYDPSSNSFVPVPVQFEYVSGVLTASLYRKGNSIYTIVQHKASFKDLPAASAYSQSIQALTNRMVINGFPDGTFKPDNKVTRAEFASMLNKTLGIIASAESTGTVFKDVPANSWYSSHVKAAVEAGIITGYEDGSFKPNQTISHQEMVTMLVKALHYAGYKAPAASDQASSTSASSEVPAWAKTYYDEAQLVGLIGIENDAFAYKTDAETTRKDSALLLYRILNDILFQ